MWIVRGNFNIASDSKLWFVFFICKWHFFQDKWTRLETLKPSALRPSCLLNTTLHLAVNSRQNWLIQFLFTLYLIYQFRLTGTFLQKYTAHSQMKCEVYFPLFFQLVSCVFLLTKCLKDSVAICRMFWSMTTLQSFFCQRQKSFTPHSKGPHPLNWA